MHDLQEAQLRLDEEQEDDAREAGVQEILSLVPGTHAAQGDEVVAVWASAESLG